MNGTIEAEDRTDSNLFPSRGDVLAATQVRRIRSGGDVDVFLSDRPLPGQNMIALPVFPSRRLFQTELSYHVDSGITKPEDLAGKRLGVAEYQQTAALWIRGILEHDFGVSQYKVHWYGAQRGDESRRRHRFQAACRHFIQPYRAEQEPGVNLIGKRIGRRPCREPLGTPC